MANRMDGLLVGAEMMSKCENDKNDNTIQWETAMTITDNPPLA